MQIGSSVGPYRILRHLGSGGMGAVWLAEDTRLHRQVALKTVRADHTDDASRQRLMREARAAAALNHPHIATVHDVIETNGEVVIVFEYVEGETLHAALRRGPLAATAAVDIAIQIAKALVAAHAQGVIHRDLKPANVIVGGGGHVKVLDFGIARMVSAGTTDTASALSQTSGVGFIGTPGYAAPEQMVSSAVDERADLYALGVMLFEMISGRRPFTGNDPIQLASSKLSQDAPLLSSTGKLVPPALDQFVASLLERDRADRPSSAVDALGKLADIAGRTDPAGPMPARRLWLSIAAVVMIAALAGFGAWELNRFVRPVAVDPSAPPVIAVLPLANVSGDPSKDHVAAGIAESLISSLASLPSVTVLSRASVTEARSRAKDEAALAKDLGVTYVVNGSVQESNGTLKISLNLVKPDRTVAWGDSVEGAFERIFDLQSRLANALTTALVVRVSATERQRMNQQPTANPQAMSAYWRGRALFERGDIRTNLESAIAAYTEAVALDPRFALAHAALGQAYWSKYNETRDPEWTRKAIEAGTTALRLEPDRAEVRYTLAVTLAGSGRLDEAIEELNRALALQPTSEEVRRRLGQVLARRGRVDEAISEFQKALALRPTSALTYATMGNALMGAARYAEAAEAYKRLTTLQPDNSNGFQQLGTAYQMLGRADEALQNYNRAIALQPSPQSYSNVGALHHSRGEYELAVAAYSRAIALRPNSAPTRRNLGDALTRLGRHDDARRAYLEAVKLVDAELQVNPRDGRLLAASAVYLQKSGQSDLALERLNAALQRDAADVEVQFRAAVVHALSNRTSAAISALKRAIEGGYSLTSVREADELDSIRELPEYEALLQLKK